MARIRMPKNMKNSTIPRMPDTFSKAAATGNKYRISTSNARKMSA